MKLKLQTEILDIEGEVIGNPEWGYLLTKDGKDLEKDDTGSPIKAAYEPKDGPTPLLLVDVVKKALLSDKSENPQMPITSKVKTDRYALFYKISQIKKGQNEMSLTAEEVITLKDSLLVSESTIIAGQICIVFDK